MSKPIETFVLVEMRTVIQHDHSKTEVIRTIVRTYESSERADQDVELLNQLMPDAPYRVLAIEHLDR